MRAVTETGREQQGSKTCARAHAGVHRRVVPEAAASRLVSQRGISAAACVAIVLKQRIRRTAIGGNLCRREGARFVAIGVIEASARRPLTRARTPMRRDAAGTLAHSGARAIAGCSAVRA